MEADRMETPVVTNVQLNNTSKEKPRDHIPNRRHKRKKPPTIDDSDDDSRSSSLTGSSRCKTAEKISKDAVNNKSEKSSDWFGTADKDKRKIVVSEKTVEKNISTQPMLKKPISTPDMLSPTSSNVLKLLHSAATGCSSSDNAETSEYAKQLLLKLGDKTCSNVNQKSSKTLKSVQNLEAIVNQQKSTSVTPKATVKRGTISKINATTATVKAPMTTFSGTLTTQSSRNITISNTTLSVKTKVSETAVSANLTTTKTMNITAASKSGATLTTTTSSTKTAKSTTQSSNILRSVLSSIKPVVPISLENPPTPISRQMSKAPISTVVSEPNKETSVQNDIGFKRQENSMHRVASTNSIRKSIEGQSSHSKDLESSISVSVNSTVMIDSDMLLSADNATAKKAPVNRSLSALSKTNRSEKLLTSTKERPTEKLTASGKSKKLSLQEYQKKRKKRSSSTQDEIPGVFIEYTKLPSSNSQVNSTRNYSVDKTTIIAPKVTFEGQNIKEKSKEKAPKGIQLASDIDVLGSILESIEVSNPLEEENQNDVEESTRQEVGKIISLL